MKTTEAQILRDIRVALGRLGGCVFWRNSRGVHDVNGRKIPYGLAPGASDLIGMVRCMGSETIGGPGIAEKIHNARFCALEVKCPGEKPTEEQETFMGCVRLYGGFAAVVTSVEEALNAVERCRRGEKE